MKGADNLGFEKDSNNFEKDCNNSKNTEKKQKNALRYRNAAKILLPVRGSM